MQEGKRPACQTKVTMVLTTLARITMELNFYLNFLGDNTAVSMVVFAASNLFLRLETI